MVAFFFFADVWFYFYEMQLILNFKASVCSLLALLSSLSTDFWVWEAPEFTHQSEAY